ncbi:hypothetical protein HD554DRAFT_2238635 [Boletus coccyginus]|nr:hypothetical protein HD554DRAFT_2238635 [Boletus coccyginus]
MAQVYSASNWPTLSADPIISTVHLNRCVSANPSILQAAYRMLQNVFLSLRMPYMRICIVALESIGDEASNTDKWDKAVAAYSTALSLGPTFLNPVMSAHETSSAANKNELPEDASMHNRLMEWELNFKACCMKALEQNRDVAMDSASYGDAVDHYSAALSLNPLSVVIKLNPSSLNGHKRKHAALLGAWCYTEAIDAYNDMLLMLEQSMDPVTQELCKTYITPLQTKAAICSAVKRTQRDALLVVINTKISRLCDQYGSVLQESLTSMFQWYHHLLLTIIHLKGVLSDSEKLCFAVTRIAMKQEDMAYSLFGIFDVSLSVTYGEGQQWAVGRLLQEVLTRSGDVTILTWMGKASDYNSCLSVEISMYHEPALPYVPSLIKDEEMDGLVTELQTSLKTVEPAMMLYD